MNWFDSLLDNLKAGAIEAAKKVALGFVKEGAADAEAFVEMAWPAIQRYLNLLLSKQITEDEFRSLVLGLRDLAEMKGLTAAGLVAIEVDRTRNAILKTITSIAIGAVGKML